MSRRAYLPFGLLLLLHILFLSAHGYAQSPVGTGQQPKGSASTCHELSFSGRITGGEKYSRELGETLWIRFAPLKDNWGWDISVTPANGDDDYAWPVNPPLRGDNSQYLGTGWGETVEHRLGFEHRIFFALSRADYDQAVKLVNDEAMSKDPGGAGRYLAALPTIPAGVLYVKPMKFEPADEGKAVNWMEYSVTVITPASFHPASDLAPKERPCPPMHWGP
jgi:hypothetical protein